MSSFAKTTVLSLTLLAGAAFAAHAQSGSVAALPPGTAAAPPAAAPIAPSAAYPGPNPGSGYYGGMGRTQATVDPSPNKQEGTSPGAGWYPKEQQSQDVKPSTPYPGVRPN
jgi:hypothetical protein